MRGLVVADQADLRGARAVPLTEPSAKQSVGLVVSMHEPLSPLARALRSVLQATDVACEIEQMTVESVGMLCSAAQ